MDEQREKAVLKILEYHTEGLTIGQIAKILKVTRTTAARDLDALVAASKIKRREIGKVKLHYLPKHLTIKQIIASLSIFFLLSTIISLVYAVTWTTLSQSDFNLGTYFNTTYNSTGSYVMLNNTSTTVYSPFGNYTSKNVL